MGPRSAARLPDPFVIGIALLPDRELQDLVYVHCFVRQIPKKKGARPNSISGCLKHSFFAAVAPHAVGGDSIVCGGTPPTALWCRKAESHEDPFSH